MFAGIFLIGYVVFCTVFDSASSSTNFSTLVRRSRQSQTCILPPHPVNGHWTLLNGYGNPGERVHTNSLLEFSCNARYKLDSNKHVICFNGWNVQKMPECEPLCDPRFSTSITFLQCFNKKGNEISCKEPTSGSYMRYDCRAFYEPTPGQRKITYCLDGLWSHETPECRPICGRKNDAMSLIYGGTVLNKLIYPWIVAIYKKENDKYLNICGGTIIHRKAVLTAAHCVTNEYADAYPVGDYYVAAAKIYNNFRDSRDKDVQFLKVSHFVIHPQYKGDSRRFLGDIALIITEAPLKLNSFVRPACINDLTSIRIFPGSIGEIAGWGVTNTGLPSEELRALEIPHKDEQICVQELPTEWAEKYNIIDKMCAGYPEKNVSVCKGDSGAGLAFMNLEDNRYYVHGIVSLAPSTKTGSFCNILTSALYTKVSFYYDFVDVQINRLNWCKLPNYPKNGKWVLHRSPNRLPGDLVSPYDLVEVLCNRGYNLTSPSSIFNCEALVLNVPSCVGSGNNEISEEDQSAKNSPTPPSYTAVTVNNYEGDCGKKVSGSSPQQFSNGEPVLHLDSPWVVGVYKGRKFQTHGTIVSRRLVISVARYLSVWDNWAPLNPEELTVTTQKYYNGYADPRDVDVTFYGVDKILLFSGFKGVKDGLYGDLGFAVIKGAIEFTQWVKPVCVKGVNNILIQPGDIMEIVGYVNNDNIYRDEPRTAEVAFKVIGKCLQETRGLSSFLSQDAMCGGSVDSSICVRDQGAGLTYKNPVDGRYYLVGIFAFSLSDCVRNNTFYVNTKYHYDYIVEQMNKYN